jgi:hypothetical protein
MVKPPRCCCQTHQVSLSDDHAKSPSCLGQYQRIFSVAQPRGEVLSFEGVVAECRTLARRISISLLGMGLEETWRYLAC